MIKRRKTIQVKVGGVKIGGNAPVSIQSMAKVETSRVSAVISQIKALEKCGCQIIRVAVRTLADAKAIKDIKNKINIPLVADIHFDYRLALKSIESGADKIRLNPGNMRKIEEIEEVARAAKKARIPIRIGVNSGSLFTNDERRATPNHSLRSSPGQASDERTDAFVKSAMRYIKLFEKLDFHDIIISLKGSDVSETVEAYKAISKKCDYPLHLGVTASGPYDYGIIKSSIGIGSLLLDGIGDTIRVSLTAEPLAEVIAAKRILSSLGLRRFGHEIISCPTCGRCRVDLKKIVKELELKLTPNPQLLTPKSPLTVAVMGCEVNGPGEAKGADIGIAFGKNAGILFKKGKAIKKVSVSNAVKELVKLLIK